MASARFAQRITVARQALRGSEPRPDSRWPETGDLVRAVIFTLICLILAPILKDEISDGGGRDFDAIAAGLTILACAPIAYRRIFPALAAVTTLSISLAGIAVDIPMTGPLVVGLTLVGLATSRGGVRLAGSLGIFSGLVVATVALIGARSDPDGPVPVLAIISGFAVGMLPALIGERFRAERARTRDARELAERVEQLRDGDVQRAVAEERLRIARDLHDITGHHLSAIALQSAGAGRTTRDPDARAAFERIHGLTGDALGQTRQSLGILRQESEPLELAPSPRLEHAGRLLEPARGAGIEVQMRVEGEERELSETVEMCGYRVIQESLTNVVRHADADTVVVTVAYGEETLAVTVEDDGVGGGGRPVRPGGGIEGMRERVSLVGGTLEAAPREGHGWLVRAELPLEDGS